MKNLLLIYNKIEMMKHDMMVREDISKLINKDSICLELGVAEGNFSKSLLERSNNIKHLFSIDMWNGDRGHDDNQYFFILT